MADRTLGPGAKGDIENPGLKHYEVDEADAPEDTGEPEANAGFVTPEDPDDTADLAGEDELDG